MNVFKSLVFSSKGSFDILGIPVYFKPWRKRIPKKSTESLFKRYFRTILKTLSLQTLHTFIHEMGHALAYKYFAKESPKVTIFIDSQALDQPTSKKRWSGEIEFNNKKLSHFKKAIFYASGSIASISLCFCELVFGLFLSSIWFPLGMIFFIVGCYGIYHEIHSEVLNYTQKGTDFWHIRKKNKSHLKLAITIIVTQCAIGILIVTYCLEKLFFF